MLTKVAVRRLVCGLTQREVAHRAGVHPSVVCLTEKRRLVAKEEVRRRIAEVLGLRVEEAFTEDGLARAWEGDRNG
ncbi:MAG TPA: helix-turn-helix domain-containing protein [Clostridia bacterium]|nr:helix-turn-helix domain-containing protein [Clostridia bacterium]